MITTITGTNSFLIQRELKQRIDQFISENGELTLEQLDGEENDYQKIYDSLNNLPFLAPKKLVVIRNGSANKDFTASAESLIDELPDSTDLMIVETKLDKRSLYYKLLKQKTNYLELNDLAGNELANWLVEQSKLKGGQLTQSDANYLINLAGTSQIKLHNELLKLLTYSPDVTRASIDLLIDPIPQTTVFQLLDAVFSSQMSKAIAIYDDQRLQKVEPQQLIAMLAWQVHILALVKSAYPKTPGEVAKLAGLNPFVVNKNWAIAKRLSWPEIKNIINRLAIFDIKLKTRMVEADDVMRYLILSMAQN